ncbi:hypothetical protein IF1G_09776 [Cordyceps javanica]|uniref:Uncharacterized protein n=1 Tax=Cordyceps javanica TaxID=43265 RepID=A0A545UQG7_9HYPO|nr:hypothetical protein IF1G_09776 [Cordyceps javanica]
MADGINRTPSTQLNWLTSWIKHASASSSPSDQVDLAGSNMMRQIIKAPAILPGGVLDAAHLFLLFPYYGSFLPSRDLLADS